MKSFHKLFFVLLVLTVSACSHFIKKDAAERFEGVEISHAEYGSTSFSVSGDYKSQFGEIPLDDHPLVDKWIAYFTGNGRDLMRTYLERSSRYLPMMRNVIRESGLPEELVYVPLIESGFSSKAHSRANAVGYWQFIASTGRRYGLRINGFVDERRDPVLSTRAAVEFFKDLYSLFGSWHLALAAYNAGEYKINRVVLRYYNRNFWHLVKKKGLPSETKNYVPKFIAAVRIASDPQKYGFSQLAWQESLNYDVVPVLKPLSLKKLTQVLGLSYEQLKNLNPAYKGEYVPVYARDMVLRVPIGFKALAEAALDKSRMNKPKYGYYDYYWYRVRRGDSLYKIARRNRITLSSLKRENGIRRSSLIRVGQKLKVPSGRVSANLASKKARRQSKRQPASAFHVVRRGESLSAISKKRRISVADLKSFNNLKGDQIHPGQKMRLHRDPTPVKNQASAAVTLRHHIVRKGETLIGIAKQYQVNLMKLLDVNALNLNSVILTGTRLVIPAN